MKVKHIFIVILALIVVLVHRQAYVFITHPFTSLEEGTIVGKSECSSRRYPIWTIAFQPYNHDYKCADIQVSFATYSMCKPGLKSAFKVSEKYRKDYNPWVTLKGIVCIMLVIIFWLAGVIYILCIIPWKKVLNFKII